MDELLQKLLEAEVLSSDTKSELEEAFNTKLTEAIESAKEDATADVRAELTEQWINERETLIEAIDSKVTEYLNIELTELKEDIDKFRDLEAEYAEKLVEAKASMADELESDLKELVTKMDTFLEMRLAAEIDELREDIEVVRKNEFGRRVFEGVMAEFMENYIDEDSAQITVREIKNRLNDTERALKESEAKLSELERGSKLDEVLSPLSGRQREVMEAILQNVDTEHLEEGYKTFIGRVIRETDDSEKEKSVLAESEKDSEETEDTKKTKKKSKKDDDDKSEECEDKEVEEGVAVSGDTTDETLKESSDPATQQRIDNIRRLAGII